MSIGRNPEVGCYNTRYSSRYPVRDAKQRGENTVNCISIAETTEAQFFSKKLWKIKCFLPHLVVIFRRKNVPVNISHQSLEAGLCACSKIRHHKCALTCFCTLILFKWTKSCSYKCPSPLPLLLAQFFSKNLLRVKEIKYITKSYKGIGRARHFVL